MSFIKRKIDIGNEYMFDRGGKEVAFTGTEDYLPWIGIAMASIMEHNKGYFHFHILIDHISQSNLDRFERFSNLWHIPVSLYYMNDNYLSLFCKFKRYYINGKYLASLMYRFVIPDILSDKIDRVLYLDGDVVCNGDLAPLFNVPMGNNIVIASEDRRGREFAKRIHVEKYFNSGMLLINVSQWKSENLTSNFLRRMKFESETNPELPCPDQDVLNKLLAKRVIFVGHKYNMPYRLVQPSIFKPKIINENPKTASIIHFIGAIKPWTIYNQSVPIVKVWAHAKINSPWKDIPLHEPTSQKAIHQAARDARRRHSYWEMVKLYIRFIKSKMDGTKTVGY